MIVADANLVAYLYIDGEYTPEAWRVFRRDPDWHLPELWLYEWSNVLTKYIRGERMRLRDGLWMQRRAAGRFSRGTLQTRQRDALRLAASYGIAAFDAHYIVAAVTLGVPCVTEDRALRRAVPRYTLSMSEFLARTE